MGDVLTQEDLELSLTTASTRLEHNIALNIFMDHKEFRRCGIICTLGPASRDPEVLEQMMVSGMNIARLNFSHGTHEYHAETIQGVRKAVQDYSAKLGYQHVVAIALDTKGPEIRTGLLEGGATAEIELKKDDNIRLTIDRSYMEKGNNNVIYVDYENLIRIVKPGNRIFVDDGLMSLVCNTITGTFINCTVENGGMLGSKKGVNLPGLPVDLPSVSEKDKEDFMFGLEQGVDMIFASFIREPKAINEIREILGERGKDILIIAKIENQQGMENLNAIIEAADGIMVARGDLGIEIPTEKIFLAQKSMIARCNKAGKPVVCATQMLESMVKKPRPTRAESSDVANAVLDGADCVMLSGETAKGSFPLDCIQVMAKIAKEAECAMWHKEYFEDMCFTLIKPIDATHAIAIAAVEASVKCHAAAIVVTFTCTARAAQLISKYRPKCPILAVSRNQMLARQCHLFRSIRPVIYEKDKIQDWAKEIDSMVDYGINYGKNNGYIRGGDPIVIVTGWRESSGFMNTMRILYVDDEAGCL